MAILTSKKNRRNGNHSKADKGAAVVAKNLGSSPNDANAKAVAKTVNTDDIFQQKAWFGNIDSDNAVKFFMEAPDDFVTMVLRSVISDRKQQMVITRLADRYRRYSDERHMNMLYESLVGSRAINGRALVEAMQVSINIMAEQLMIGMTGVKLSRTERQHMQQQIEQQMKARNPQAANPGV